MKTYIFKDEEFKDLSTRKILREFLLYIVYEIYDIKYIYTDLNYYKVIGYIIISRYLYEYTLILI